MVTYFDVNDGDELMEEAPIQQDQAPLSWRQDAETTHSDWTIQVETDDDNVPLQTYHVHKNVLSVGPRSCEYFSTLFSTPAALSEQRERKSCIKLHSNDAEFFPVMLDFVYSPTGKLAATTENAVSLRSLARYFRCRELMSRVNQFIQKNLTVKTAVKYLRSAAERKDEKVEESARKLIVAQYRHVKNVDLIALPIELFHSIICSAGKKEHPEFKKRAIVTVRLFFEANPKDLNARRLYEMTVNLPQVREIGMDTAKGLLNLIGQLDREEDEESWLALDSLCEVCAKSLASRWEDVDPEECKREFSNPLIKGDYRASGRLIVSRLAHALQRAKADYAKLLRGKNSLHTQLSTAKKNKLTLESRLRKAESEAFVLRQKVSELEGETEKKENEAKKRKTHSFPSLYGF